MPHIEQRPGNPGRRLSTRCSPIFVPLHPIDSKRIVLFRSAMSNTPDDAIWQMRFKQYSALELALWLQRSAKGTGAIAVQVLVDRLTVMGAKRATKDTSGDEGIGHPAASSYP